MPESLVATSRQEKRAPLSPLQVFVRVGSSGNAASGAELVAGDAEVEGGHRRDGDEGRLQIGLAFARLRRQQVQEELQEQSSLLCRWVLLRHF